MANVARGRAGLGYFPRTEIRKAMGKERRHLLQEEVRPVVEEERASRVVGLKQQGAWPRWESAVHQRITWDNILLADYYRVRFLIQAVYDGLPSPANLHIWGKSETLCCALCSVLWKKTPQTCPKQLPIGPCRRLLPLAA